MVMFDLPDLGELSLEHTFYILDSEPILFVCTDIKGQRYLCSCCKLYENWVIQQVNDNKTIVDLINNKITIRSVFEQRSSFSALVIWDGNKFTTESIRQDALPVEGAFLDLDEEKESLYERELSMNSNTQLYSKLTENISFFLSAFSSIIKTYSYEIGQITECLKLVTQIYSRCLKIVTTLSSELLVSQSDELREYNKTFDSPVEIAVDADISLGNSILRCSEQATTSLAFNSVQYDFPESLAA